MNKLHFPRLVTLATSLFADPASNNHLALCLLFILVGGVVVCSDLPEMAKHIVRVATMVGIAPLFHPRLMRWICVSLVSLMVLVLILDVALLLV